MDFLFADMQTKAFSLEAFKAPVITSPVEFPSTETGTNRFSIEKLL